MGGARRAGKRKPGSGRRRRSAGARGFAAAAGRSGRSNAAPDAGTGMLPRSRRLDSYDALMSNMMIHRALALTPVTGARTRSSGELFERATPRRRRIGRARINLAGRIGRSRPDREGAMKIRRIEDQRDHRRRRPRGNSSVGARGSDLVRAVSTSEDQRRLDAPPLRYDGIRPGREAYEGQKPRRPMLMGARRSPLRSRRGRGAGRRRARAGRGCRSPPRASHGAAGDRVLLQRESEDPVGRARLRRK